tara:strand:- start:446 stop:940 length:495 start_codon:yes stop_codon:yes gene_type:complete
MPTSQNAGGEVPYHWSANSLQLELNDLNKKNELNTLSSGLYGNNTSSSEIADLTQEIADMRADGKKRFATKENDRWNAENTNVIEESALGPIKPINTTRPKGDATGQLGDNILVNGGGFSQGSQTAAASTFGTEIPNTFDREIPLPPALNPDETGMNSLYNKTI